MKGFAIAERPKRRFLSLALVLAATGLIVEPTVEYALRHDVWAFRSLNIDIELFLGIAILMYVAALVGFVVDPRSRSFQLWPTLVAIILYPFLFAAIVSIWAGWAGSRY